MASWLRLVWNNDEAQDIAEYALMLAVVLLIVVGALSAIGGGANSIFNAVAGQLSAS
jgi:Flp pilus assembly pilin Flp